MPSKNPVITVATQPEDGAVQVEVAISLRRRRPKASPAAQIAAAAESPETPRIPRITRLMALAIKFQDLVDRGEVRDYADLARLGYVTRARITQIMNLLHLAPDIQEQLLDEGWAYQWRGMLCERYMRRISMIIEWSKQRRVWEKCRAQCSVSPRLQHQESPSDRIIS
jgi:hypothetical protein